MEALIVGGGVAGLATAYHLARGGARVRVLEREPLVATHASGRNAAIFRQLDADPATTPLALETARLLEVLAPGGALLRRTGALYVGDGGALAPLVEHARTFDVEARLVDPRDVEGTPPLGAREGLLVPGDGVLDVHGVADALARETRAAEGRIETGAEVLAVLAAGGRVEGVRLRGGRVLRADAVIVAAGAWTAELARASGAPVALATLRRHLCLLERPRASVERGPVVWSLGPEVYFRPEAGGLLASPCDEDLCAPASLRAAADAPDRLARRLEAVAPALLDAGVRTTWACLRTFTLDRRFLAGPDPRLPGLFWIAGLGGRGMSCGLALGGVVAEALGVSAR